MPFLRNLVIFLLTSTFGVAFAEEKPSTITLASEEYPPYTSVYLKDFGITSAIVTAAFEMEGIQVVYEFYPSSRSLHLARLGNVDATLPWAMREERKSHYIYSDPVIETDREHFYYLTDMPISWNPMKFDFDTLSESKIATITGYNYGDKFQEAEEKELIKTVRLRNLRQSFEMLFSGRVQIVITKPTVANRVLKKYFSVQQENNLSSFPVSKSSSKYDYLLFSKQTPYGPYLAESFNKGLKELHRTGKYQQLMNSFFEGEYSIQLSK